ncbi:hypothetical protein B0H34DRAFT_214200 [Crassisporium funariophilum]|nr:hypothetical protein B0H34DRAFT_214200 [Crassisporium funariophilum]
MFPSYLISVHHHRTFFIFNWQTGNMASDFVILTWLLVSQAESWLTAFDSFDGYPFAWHWFVDDYSKLPHTRRLPRTAPPRYLSPLLRSHASINPSCLLTFLSQCHDRHPSSSPCSCVLLHNANHYSAPTFRNPGCDVGGIVYTRLSAVKLQHQTVS